MSLCLTICEYNPLHSGHIHHLEMSKRLCGADSLVCIMSGNACQRGDISIVDKYTRAVWAIQSGADIVVELPVQYVLAPAQIFGLGGVKIANLFQGENYLSFGSECGDINTLKTVAQLSSSSIVDQNIQKYLNLGQSYPKAFAMAVADACVEQNLTNLQSILSSPNNTLAVEYIKAISDTHSSLIPVTIKRESGYNDLSVDKEFCSATAIRNNIHNDDVINKYCPDYVAKDLTDISLDDSKLFALLKYNLTNCKNLNSICGIREGLDNRIRQKLDTSSTFDQLLDNIKTKRYTMAHIKRTLLNALISNTQSWQNTIRADIDFVRVLAIRKSKSHLLSLINAPIVTKPSDVEKLGFDDNLTTRLDNVFKATKYDYNAHLRIVE